MKSGESGKGCHLSMRVSDEERREREGLHSCSSSER